MFLASFSLRMGQFSDPVPTHPCTNEAEVPPRGAFSTELLNYIIAFATQGKSGHYKYLTVDLVVSCLERW